MERSHRLLSVDELLVAVDSINELESKILNHGSKLKFPLGTPEEAATIKSYQDDLRRLVSMERIARRSDRSTAHVENGSLKIVRRVGKWKLFGSSDYLKWHEALYLMEMNRLDVYFDTVIVSLERAYSLFLRKRSDAAVCGKLTKEEYAVYSHFMRNGYTIQEHSPKISSTSSSKTQQSNQSEQCIWSYLFELLGQQQHATKRSYANDDTYGRVKHSMDKTISMFKQGNVTQDAVSRKRKQEDGESTSAGHFNTNQYFGNESLNAFMIGDERTIFRKVFDEIDVIELNGSDVAEIDASESLEFSFDLWTDGVFKKTEHSQPNFRIVVLRGNRKDLPNMRYIKKLFHRQIYKCPIILVYVSDEFSFHAYIYRFTKG